MVNLNAFSAPFDALVVGASGGIGRAFVNALVQDEAVRTVHAWSRQHFPDHHQKIQARRLDVGDETQLRAATEEIGRLSLIIVATGILHDPEQGLAPERSLKSIDLDQMAESFRINTMLPALVAKHTLPHLPRRGRATFCVLSARVGSISDNRLGGWYSYRASKAALNQIIKCISIELRRTHPDALCIGLHPGTVDTGLSQPFQNSLASNHKLFTPDEAVDNLLCVVNSATPAQSGAVLAWDGTTVPA